MRRLGWTSAVLGLAIWGCGHAQEAFVRVGPPGEPDKVLAQAPPAPPEPPLLPVKPPTLDRPADSRTAGLERGPSSILARVNGEPLLVEDVRLLARWNIEEQLQRSRQGPIRQVSAEERRAIDEQVRRIIAPMLDQVIERELLYQEAMANIPARGQELLRAAVQQEIDKQIDRRKHMMGFRSDEQLRAYLDEQGLSLDGLRRQVERGMIADEYIRQRIKPKIDRIDRSHMWEYYQKNRDKFERQETVVWQHIFIAYGEGAKHLQPGVQPSVEQARLHAALVHGEAMKTTTGAEWETLAVKYSDGQSRTGEGEGTTRGSVRPIELEDVVFRAPVGQVSGVIEGRTGCHILRVVSHEPAGMIPFEKACPDIRRELQNRIFGEERQRLVREVRNKSLIEKSQQ
jgi:parvulin-like peptidyl-prolyl isomerase